MSGTVYNSYGYTDHKATKFARADRAECHDVEPNAPGSVFPPNPRQVAVWAFNDHSSKQVVGVRFGRDSFSVFIAQSVPREEAERIVRELRTD